MPEVNGIQLLNYVKGDDALRSVPVISERPPARPPARPGGAVRGGGDLLPPLAGPPT
jgi:hypothetical protein